VEDRIAATITKVVTAYVSNNSITPANLPKLIDAVRSTLNQLSLGEAKPVVAGIKLLPAVPIRKSVTPDYIVCLEDGKQFKSLKRHLMVAYGMTPYEYRIRWGLPDDYPIVAPNYSAKRTALAKQLGLGRRQRNDED